MEAGATHHRRIHRHSADAHHHLLVAPTATREEISSVQIVGTAQSRSIVTRERNGDRDVPPGSRSLTGAAEVCLLNFRSLGQTLG